MAVISVGAADLRDDLQVGWAGRAGNTKMHSDYLRVGIR